jgi:membrane fusion protein (multidrug efflux system)
MEDGPSMESLREMIGNHKRKLTTLLLIVALALVIGGVYVYLDYKKTHVSTDDAYVAGSIHTIAAKVPGTVKGIFVHDNQLIRKGDLLMEIDERDYDLRLREAASAFTAESSKLAETSAKKEVARKQLSEIQFRIESVRAALKLQEANFKQADLDLKRAERLRKKEIFPEEKLEKAKTAFDVAAAQVEATREQLKQAEASIETQNSMIKQAEAAINAQQSVVRQKEEIRKGEDLRLSYTKIFAPADGYITKKSVEKGNQIQTGQPLMAVVPLQDVWIVANYKETQIENIKPGQKVQLKVDTYPGRVFAGRVESIMAGTGAVFSLFPPENATGNYVKVVQRIPVKIVLDGDTDPQHVLRVGMSVEPTVITEK